MNFKSIGIHIMHKGRIQMPQLIGLKIKIRELLLTTINNIGTTSLIHSHFPLSLWKDNWDYEYFK